MSHLHVGEPQLHALVNLSASKLEEDFLADRACARQ